MIDFGQVVHVSGTQADPAAIIVCEHASNHIPVGLQNLGLSNHVLESHVAWDIGALGVATELARLMRSLLVHCAVSRLVYDCNRPPEASSAIPIRSEIFNITGNKNLSEAARETRINGVFRPFSDAVDSQIRHHGGRLQTMVTVHSFTPVFNGQVRMVEIGILHGKDDRLARAMMETIPPETSYDVRLNEPYSATDGVAHTLDVHGTDNGLPNVMIEIRNDLIATPNKQMAMARYFAPWISSAIDRMNSKGGRK